MSDMQLRHGRAAEALEIAEMWLRSRAASVPHIPPPVHSDEEVRAWFRDVVLPNREVWVADDGGAVVAVLVLDDDSIDQLYVDPSRTGRGIGGQLVDIAKRERPSGLGLWTFAANVGARRFYDRHGFVATDSTSGDNEEGAPDVRYEWSPSTDGGDVTSIEGELATETLEYDGGRRVTVYVPPDPPEAVVFAGDGQLISQWGDVLEAAEVPATMIVGVHRLDDETRRLHEYSPGFDPDRFAAHEDFFVGEVRRWTRSRFGVDLPRERTAAFGVSASGELALAVALRHPDVYSAVFCASPGAGYRPPDVMPNPLPSAYLVAGTLEPFFQENAARWATALRDAGADVVMTERVGSHGDPFWRDEFPLMVAWAFGR
jgi:GNAT superfamily N-acetyltransferase